MKLIKGHLVKGKHGRDREKEKYVGKDRQAEGEERKNREGEQSR